MKQTTRIAIAGLLSATASVLSCFADEFGGTATPTETNPTPEAPKKGKKAAAAAAAEEKPAETPAEPAEEPTGGKTYDELRAIIEPIVKDGKGPEVKKVIGKYAPGGGGLKELEKTPQHHAAFEKDIAALAY